jgi:Novel STAND NTPase 1
LAGGDVAALVARVGAALAGVAEAGVAHGRVVAESILFDEAGDAYLADLRLGTGGGRVPGDDVRDLAGVVAEALTGRRPIGPAIEAVPATVAEVLTAALSEAEPPQLDSFVPAVMAALSGQVGGPAYERPNPYKGLRAFDEPDAEDFFGRDALVDAVLARLAGAGSQGRLVLVVGGWGSGKSSLVRAGLLPQVRRGAATGSESWFVATMVPGGSPFKELAESLRRVAVVEADGLAGEMAASVEHWHDGRIDRVVLGQLRRARASRRFRSVVDCKDREPGAFRRAVDVVVGIDLEDLVALGQVVHGEELGQPPAGCQEPRAEARDGDVDPE